MIILAKADHVFQNKIHDIEELILILMSRDAIFNQTFRILQGPGNFWSVTVP